MNTTIDSVSKPCYPSYHDQAHVIPVFSRYTGNGFSKKSSVAKNRHDGTSKDVVNSEKDRHVHKQKKRYNGKA